MGLDHWVKEKVYLPYWEHGTDEQKQRAESIIEAVPHISDVRINGGIEVTFNAITWRKANAIHGWFVREVQDGIDDCGEYHVTADQLTELHRLCLEALRTHEVPEGLEPTEGFFFGSTDVDEWYWSDIKRTAQELGELLARHRSIAETGVYRDLYYDSSW